MAELFVPCPILALLIRDAEACIVLQKLFHGVFLLRGVLLKELVEVRRDVEPLPQSLFLLLFNIGLPLHWKLAHNLLLFRRIICI